MARGVFAALVILWILSLIMSIISLLFSIAVKVMWLVVLALIGSVWFRSEVKQKRLD